MTDKRCEDKLKQFKEQAKLWRRRCFMAIQAFIDCEGVDASPWGMEHEESTLVENEFKKWTKEEFFRCLNEKPVAPKGFISAYMSEDPVVIVGSEVSYLAVYHDDEPHHEELQIKEYYNGLGARLLYAIDRKGKLYIQNVSYWWT